MVSERAFLLDDVVSATTTNVYVPELSRLAGDGARADVEMRRIAMVEGAL